MVIDMKKKRYKLHLTQEQLNLLIRVFDSSDWFCNCKEFPECDDYKLFQKLKNRINNLFDRSIDGQRIGYKGYSKMIDNVRNKQTDLVLKVIKK